MITRRIEVSPFLECPVSTINRHPASSGKRTTGAFGSGRSLASIDVLAVCSNPALSFCLSGALQPFRWNLEEVRTVAGARDILSNHRTAVVVCESMLQDGSWTDLASHLRLLPIAPGLIVVEDDSISAGEVETLGGFGTLSMPLREADVIWTLASAWHMWMREAEAHESAGGVPCSGG